MFRELAPFLNPTTTLFITAARENETHLRLTITPRTAQADPPLDQVQKALIDTPVVITATPDELDAELPEALTRYVDTRKGVAASFQAYEARIADEEKRAQQRLSDAQKKGTDASKPAAVTGPAPGLQPALF